MLACTQQANLVTYNYNGKVDTIISAFTDKALENLVVCLACPRLPRRAMVNDNTPLCSNTRIRCPSTRQRWSSLPPISASAWPAMSAAWKALSITTPTCVHEPACSLPLCLLLLFQPGRMAITVHGPAYSLPLCLLMSRAGTM